MADKVEQFKSDVPTKPSWNGPKVYQLPADPTPVATQYLVQYTTGGEFFLTFFEESAHSVTSDGKDQFKFEDYTPVCVGRVSMSISRIPGLIKSLQKCLDNFKPKPSSDTSTSDSVQK